jgi:hypothetical protein
MTSKLSWWTRYRYLPNIESQLMKRKLDLKTIAKIRELYATGQCKQMYLAALFRLSSPQISRLVNFKRRRFE